MILDRLNKLDKYHDIGILILRVGVGLVFMRHGFPKLTSGPDLWEILGGVMPHFGLQSVAVFWGLMAALSEFGGGLLLALGLFARPAAFFLFFTMTMATGMHLSNGDAFSQYANALTSAVVFLSLILMGPGKYALEKKLFRNN